MSSLTRKFPKVFTEGEGESPANGNSGDSLFKNYRWGSVLYELVCNDITKLDEVGNRKFVEILTYLSYRTDKTEIENNKIRIQNALNKNR